MIFKVVPLFALSTVLALSLVAQEQEAADGAEGAEDPALEAEIAYVQALVDYGYPDIAAPVIEATKKKWPQSEVLFFAIEIRGLLSLGKFAEAESKIAALPDRKGTKYWAARLTVANNYFGRGQKEECMKIYDEFFKVYAKPPPEIKNFYQDACYTYGQLLVNNNNYAKAAERYEDLLKQLKGDDWCNLACETCDIYLKLIEDTPATNSKVRGGYLKSANKIADKLLWQIEKPVFFGRAVSMKALLKQMSGDVVQAAALIDEYRPQLEDLHNQIVQYDPEGRRGLLRQSPLPLCLYLQAKILWDAAKEEYKNPKRDDEKVKSFMFGPKVEGRRDVAKGAFAMAQGVFLNYESSSWAPQAGDLAQEIRDFAVEKYKAKIKTKITEEQIARVRAAQFRDANEKFVSGQYLKAIEAYYSVLSKFPEYPESLQAIENIASSYLDLIIETKDKTAKVEYRQDLDAVESYLAERFCEFNDKMIMTTAGDAVIRLAAKEAEYKNHVRSNELYFDFCSNYRRHTGAATIAASKASELQRAERYEEAIRFWNIVATIYTNSPVYAASLAQLSACYGKLGDRQKEITYISDYLKVETLKIRRLQAQMQLAQMYQRRGLEMLAAAATNSLPEEIEREEKKGTAQIIYAVKNFRQFNKEAADAIKDPTTNAEDKSKYMMLREAALFLVGECWSRMNRPEQNLKMYRARAAESYETYLSEFPKGQWAKAGYVKLGTIYTALGEMEKSKSALDRLSRFYPDSDEAKNSKPRLAKNLIEMGLKKEGAELYGEMLRTEGKYTATHYLNAGEALIEAKSWDYANQAFEKAVRLANSNQTIIVAKARLGQAKSAWKQGSLVEAREALDNFLNNPKMAKMAIAADANFMLVEVASEQGRAETDSAMRGKYFGAAIGALKKVRQYWRSKPVWQQDELDLLSGDVLVDRMFAEEKMGLKEDALETCGRAASVFQVFLQAHGPSEALPLEKMAPEQLKNLQRAYETMVPLFSKMGAQQADRVIKYGQEYLDMFPNASSSERTKISNCMNQARADLPSGAPTQP